jgi:hypothetical protein
MFLPTLQPGETGHVVQQVAPEPVADSGQSASLVIGQSQASSTRVLLQNPVFFPTAGIQDIARQLSCISLHLGRLLFQLTLQDTKNGFQLLNGKKYMIRNMSMPVPFLFTKYRISGLIFGEFSTTS